MAPSSQPGPSADSLPSAPPSVLALAALERDYPVLANPGTHQDDLRVLQQYLDGALHTAEEHGLALEALVRVGELTGDVGVGAELFACYVEILDQLNIPHPASRATHARVMRDQAELVRRAVERAEARALLDPVSGLPTRSALYRTAGVLISESQASRRSVAALCIDIDHASKQMDQPGHPTQEDLMAAIVSRIRGALRPQDVVGRTGNLEFTVLMGGLASPGFANLAANRVIGALAEPIQLGQDEVMLSLAIGIASIPSHAESPEGLLACARTAARELRHNSSQYVEPFLVYNGGQAAEVPDVENIKEELRHAISQNDLILYFQPQLDLRSGRIRSVEALLRWQRRPGEWMNPEAILKLAEAHLTGPLSAWIVRRAVLQLGDWRRLGLHDVSIGVNLPPGSLLEPHLADAVSLELGTFNVPAEYLKIEITESAVIEDSQRSLQTLNELNGIGVTIAIDDFGTGYSSLEWLREMPLRELKIDRLFIRDLLKSPRDALIVRSVIKLAHDLGLQVVAEGVEDGETLEALRRMACDRIQGYWVSRPLAPDACTAFLLHHDQNPELAAP